MKLFAALATSIILLFSANVNAGGKEITGNYNNILITVNLEEACSNETVLGFLKPELVPVFKKGHASYEGKEFELCWTNDPKLLKQLDMQGHIIVVDEFYNIGGVPVEAFTKEDQNRI